MTGSWSDESPYSSSPKPNRGNSISPSQRASMLSNYSLSEDDDDESIEKQWEKQRLARRSFEKWQAQKDAEKARKRLQSKSMVNTRTHAHGASDGLRSRSQVFSNETNTSPMPGHGKTYEKWLEEKLEFERYKNEQIRKRAEMERRRREGLLRDEDGLNPRQIAKLHRLSKQRSELKSKLLKETSQLDFVPSRPGSGMDELRRPSEEEAWALGLEIVRMQDKLNKIAPGGGPPPQPRANSFPQALPPLPKLR
eukprot:m.22959 g.22959  ORF g.22959 m.22959 type:complete len:252 (+) comp7453_c0_seq3:269-1024(+)